MIFLIILQFQLNRPTHWSNAPTHFGQLPIQKYMFFANIITFPFNVCFVFCQDITIGFTEGQSRAFVTLAKDAGRMSQRSDIAASISLGPGPSATPHRDFSIPLLDSRIDFENSDQSINIPLSILEDNLSEGVESFTLSVESADFLFDATRTDTFQTTQVFITDNDGTFELYTTSRVDLNGCI